MCRLDERKKGRLLTLFQVNNRPYHSSTIPDLRYRQCTRSVPSTQTVHLPSFHLSVLRPKTGTQCDTSATYLRKQISKLRESDRPQTRGSAQGPFSPSLATGTLGHPWPADVHCRQLRQGRRIWREPRTP
ncbi:hypothetical protein [Desulfosporosinus metallidurans]|uniref:hypothetical protein n=1 Tax=Desulfosporosinus metallidurans TaxID=1888891 RepID=UPI00147B6B42|nr:hypothetical protein [Desulfosporosinus metallidurans]